MAFKDLREFIAELEKRSLLSRVKKEVDWNLEVGAIMKRVFDAGGPAVVFERVKDSDVPLLSGAMGTYERYAIGIDCANDIRSILAKILDAVGKPTVPVAAARGACQENVLRGKEIDLYRFPTPHWHPLDGGRFIGTLGVVITRDPETGKRNMGIYREQILDRDKTGLLAAQHVGITLQKYRAMKRPMPIATCIGVDPAILAASCLQLPLGEDELGIAGALRGEPVELVQCKTVDLQVPASAEIVLEGSIPPDDAQWMEEGPFGEFTGYYGGDRMKRPTIYLSAVTHRDRPIYQGTFEDAPPNESAVLRTIGHTAGLWEKLKKTGVPGIKDVFLRGCASFIAVISLERQYYGGHARQVIDAVWAVAGGVKWVIVVDGDIDVFDWEQVEWALSTRVQPHRDIVISDERERGLHLDPSIPPEVRPYPINQSSRIGIDATTQFKGFAWPDPVQSTAETMAAVKARWKEYGIS
ncbi:MAG: hypothetical protein A3F90_02605 [Deltaproteobacteria bacterium RIFCSPLOWO2_12_FULL_60_19]|nr:MAG: hypothetical protein A3F90_02605 [Deltaproteobacteria bacterium RIFCSPLOWO2_12_FULL_60_19]